MCTHQESIKIREATGAITGRNNRQTSAVVGVFNTPLPVVDRSQKHKNTNDVVYLKNTNSQLDQIDRLMVVECSI